MNSTEYITDSDEFLCEFFTAQSFTLKVRKNTEISSKIPLLNAVEQFRFFEKIQLCKIAKQQKNTEKLSTKSE